MNSIKYRSKISLLFVLALLLYKYGFLMFLFSKSLLFAVGYLLFTAIFLIPPFLNTYYKIVQDKLWIQSGWLYKKSIDIQKIRKVTSSRAIVSAPALSLQRLEIFYNAYDSVLVSPKKEAEFLNALTQLNPLIEIDLKK